jgi:hypothetical protein
LRASHGREAQNESETTGRSAKAPVQVDHRAPLEGSLCAFGSGAQARPDPMASA